MPTTVLVAGATGALGSRIAHYLTAQDDVRVRLLVRGGWAEDPRRSARINPLVERGAEVVEGDVQDPASLPAATRDVDVVVSALQGGDDVINAGQVALAQAAVANGARRFIPSDFALDLFHAPEGAPQFEARKSADAAIRALDIDVLHVLQGGFLDQSIDFEHPAFVDLAGGTITYWGTGHEEFDLTTLEDTAAFTARLATDPDAPAGVHTISGARTSFAAIADAVERVTGVALRHQVLGSVDDLRDAIEAKGGSWNAIMEWYFLALVATPPLRDTENDRYPDARPHGLDEFLRAQWERSGMSRAIA